MNTTATAIETLASISLWESTTEGLVNKPVTVEHHEDGFRVVREGETIGEAHKVAADAMAAALELCGWAHAVKDLL